jgi:hypothetical protein
MIARKFRTAYLVRSFAAIAIILLLSSCATVKQPDVPFELLYGMSLSDTDKADILNIAQQLIDKPIQKVVARPMLPTSEPIVFVRYGNVVAGTYVIETTLIIYGKNPRNWKAELPDSLSIRSGRWGSKPELLQWEALRTFSIDEIKINLSVPDGMSYDEMRRLLQAIKNKEIIWEEQRFIKDFAVEDISRVTLEGPEPLYVVSIVKQHSPPGYFVYARLEGAKLVVKRTDMVIP